ncbi:MAG: COG4315 family predicted lipoprotein [Acidimicrobiales bacterium]
MSRTRRMVAGAAGLAVGLAVGALALAACSSGVITTASYTVTPTTTRGVTISTEESPAGRVLATPSGFTLYDFTPDTSETSACTTRLCVRLWPPLLTTGHPVVGKGLTPALVGTIARSDGQLQVTYGGHPLYTFLGDRFAGMVTGQALLNVGGYWYVIGPHGAQVTTQFRVTRSAIRTRGDKAR